MLVRCKKMYGARVDVKRILLLIIKKEEEFDRRGGVYDLLEKNKNVKRITKSNEESLWEGL